MSQETTETGRDHIFVIMGNMTRSSFDPDTYLSLTSYFAGLSIRLRLCWHTIVATMSISSSFCNAHTSLFSLVSNCQTCSHLEFRQLQEISFRHDCLVWAEFKSHRCKLPSISIRWRVFDVQRTCVYKEAPFWKHFKDGFNIVIKNSLSSLDLSRASYQNKPKLVFSFSITCLVFGFPNIHWFTTCT